MQFLRCYSECTLHKPHCLFIHFFHCFGGINWQSEKSELETTSFSTAVHSSCETGQGTMEWRNSKELVVEKATEFTSRNLKVEAVLFSFSWLEVGNFKLWYSWTQHKAIFILGLNISVCTQDWFWTCSSLIKSQVCIHKEAFPPNWGSTGLGLGHCTGIRATMELISYADRWDMPVQWNVLMVTDINQFSWRHRSRNRNGSDKLNQIILLGMWAHAHLASTPDVVHVAFRLKWTTVFKRTRNWDLWTTPWIKTSVHTSPNGTKLGAWMAPNANVKITLN